MKIDLGQKYPSPAIAVEAPDEKTSYPTLYFTVDEECEIPDHGTAVITFRKVEDAENVRDPEDPKYRYELEVQSIDVKGDSSKNMVSVADAFKKAIKDKVAQKMDDGEEE